MFLSQYTGIYTTTKINNYQNTAIVLQNKGILDQNDSIFYMKYIFMHPIVTEQFKINILNFFFC